MEGTGTLNILSGGSVTSGLSTIGFDLGSSGTATVSGAGSTWNTSSGNLFVGTLGAGVLNVLDGGSVTTASLYLSLKTGSSSSLIVNGGGVTTDTIIVGVGATPTIRLTNPAVGNGGTVYALTLGGSNGSTTLGMSIADAAAGEGGAAGVGGAGGIRKTGTGTLTLNAANTFSGGMRIDGGSVVLGNALALQSSTAILNVDNGLNLNGLSSVTLGGLSGTGALAFGSTALTVGGNNASTTYGGALSGTAVFTKTGTGTLTLSAANTLGGRLVINGGGIALGGDLGVNGLTGTGAIDLGSSLLTVGGGNTTYDGVISGTGGIRKVNSTTLFLSGASTFSGGTQIDGGRVSLLNGLALQNSTVTLNVNGGLNIASSTTLGGLAGTGALNTGDRFYTLTVGNNNASTTYGGVLNGTGKFIKTGTGTLTLTAVGSSVGGRGNTGGATDTEFNNGTTLITGANASSYATLATGTDGWAYIGRNAGDDGTVTVRGTDGAGNASALNVTNNLVVGESGTAALNILDGARVTSRAGFVASESTSTATVTVSGAGSSWTTGGNLLYVGNGGTGTLNVLNGGSVSSGFSRLGARGARPGTVTVSGADSSWSAGDLEVGVTAAGTLNILDGGTVTSGTTYVGNRNRFTSGPGTVTVNGPGSSWSVGGTGLTLGDSDAGILNVTAGGSVAVAGEVLLADESTASASLIVNGGRLSADRIRVGSGLTPVIKLTNPTAANGGGHALTLGTGNGDTTLGVSIGDAAAGEGGAASVGGAGGIRKVGTGTLTLTGASTYSGGTLIEGGTVIARGGTITGTTLESGALGTGAVTVAAGATLAVGQAANATAGTALGGLQTLAVSSLTLTGGSDTPLLTFNLGAGGASDLLRFSGDANALMFSGSGTFALGFASASGGALTGNAAYTLMTFAAPLAAGSVSLSDPNARLTAVGTGNLRAPRDASFAWQTDGGGNIIGLLFSSSGAELTVPEPGSVALLLAGASGALGAAALRRRRRPIA